MTAKNRHRPVRVWKGDGAWQWRCRVCEQHETGWWFEATVREAAAHVHRHIVFGFQQRGAA